MKIDVLKVDLQNAMHVDDQNDDNHDNDEEDNQWNNERYIMFSWEVPDTANEAMVIRELWLFL